MDFFYKDGEYYLSEINPRFGGAYLHAYGAGVDFVKLIKNNIDGIENENQIGQYDEGVLMLMYDDVVITKEQILILRMIAAGLADGAEKRGADRLVEEWLGLAATTKVFSFEEEVKRAAEALSDAMLMAKFIQGLPVIGAAGGISNPIVYQKVSQYASLKYKKRYLAAKRQSV